MPIAWSELLLESTRQWISRSLDAADLAEIFPDDDPVRLWWSPQDADPVERLLDVVCGSGDALTLVAVIQAALAKSADPPPAGMSQVALATLVAEARAYRSQSYPREYHAFLSYSHRDMPRAVALVDILAGQGVRVFHDVRDIHAGSSIVGELHAAMSRARHAIMLVTEHYAQSVWADRELRHLNERRRNGLVVLLPVLLDDVPLPELLADTLTIDLRGFRAEGDRNWAEARLHKLVRVCTAR